MLVDVEQAPMLTAVDLTIDGLLVIADTLGGVADDFPLVVGVSPDNIFDDELRARVWADVREKLTEQNVLTPAGEVHRELVDLIETTIRPERTLEGRWWRKQTKQMVRFAICRRAGEHIIIARCNDKVVLQRVAASVGLAGMVEAIIGAAAPAAMGPVTGPVDELSKASDLADFTRYGCDVRSASTLLAATRQQVEWVHLVATETLPGGRVDRPAAAVGILDSQVGRVVSLPKIVGYDLHTTFMAGSHDNIARALHELTGFLPSQLWAYNNNGTR
jgi:hypothetical protein